MCPHCGFYDCDGYCEQETYEDDLCTVHEDELDDNGNL